MKKKIIILALCVSLAAIAVIGSTMAYFTDSVTSAGNTFTAGNVEIELIVSDEDITATGTDVNTNVYDEQANVKKANVTIMPGDKLQEFAYIKNTGNLSAYVRLRVLVPVSLYDIVNITSSYTYDETKVYSKAVEDIESGDAPDIIEKNGIDYHVVDFIYKTPIEPGDITACKTWEGIEISQYVTAEKLKEIAIQDNDNVDQFKVLYEADAIQTSLVFKDNGNNVESAIEAFKAFDIETTTATTPSEPIE